MLIDVFIIQSFWCGIPKVMSSRIYISLTIICLFVLSDATVPLNR